MLLTYWVIALVLLAILIDQLILVHILLLIHKFLIHCALSRAFILLCEESLIWALESHNFARIFLCILLVYEVLVLIAIILLKGSLIQLGWWIGIVIVIITRLHGRASSTLFTCLMISLFAESCWLKLSIRTLLVWAWLMLSMGLTQWSLIWFRESLLLHGVRIVVQSCVVPIARHPSLGNSSLWVDLMQMWWHLVECLWIEKDLVSLG